MEVTKEYAFSSRASRWQPGPFLSAKPLFLSCFALRRLLVNLGQEDAEVCVPGHFDGVLCAPQKNGTSAMLLFCFFPRPGLRLRCATYPIVKKMVAKICKSALAEMAEGLLLRSPKASY